MKNKKGFTLVELLAIIVILAVIMVIAVPKILDVVNGSKTSAWKNSVGMIKKAIVNNSQLLDPETGVQKYSISNLCANPSKLKEIVKLEDTTVTCSNNVFSLTGTGQFAGKSATITCSNNKCSVNSDNTVLAAGLYDSNNNLIASWDELVNTYGMDVSWYYHLYDEENNIEDDLNFINYLSQDTIDDDYTMDYAELGVTKAGWYRRVESGYAQITDFSTVKSNAPAIIFQKYDNLKVGAKLIIPGDIKVIKFNAFMNCVNLEEIILSEGIQKIGEAGFANCVNMKSIELPNTLNFIDQGAFWNCNSIASLVIPGSVYIVGEVALGMCNSLADVVFSEGVLSIDSGLFENDFNLRNIYFPRTLVSLDQAFTKVDENGWSTLDTSQISITFADAYNWGKYKNTSPFYDPISDLNTYENIQAAIPNTILKTVHNNIDWDAIYDLNDELNNLTYNLTYN